MRSVKVSPEPKVVGVQVRADESELLGFAERNDVDAVSPVSGAREFSVFVGVACVCSVSRVVSSFSEESRAHAAAITIIPPRAPNDKYCFGILQANWSMDVFGRRLVHN